MSVESVFKYVCPKPQRVVILSKELPQSVKIELLKYGRVEFVDEDSVIEGLNFSNMPQIVVDGVNVKGWFLQQFLKWEARRLSQTDDYMVIDADVVFIKETDFIRDNKYVFRTKRNFYAPYFEAYKNYFGYLPDSSKSYVSDYMIFNKKFLNEIILKIEEKQAGKKWYEIVLAHFKERVITTFSEYEFYGCYMEKFYRDRIQIIQQGADYQYSMKNPSLNRLLFIPSNYSHHHSFLKFMARRFGFSGLAYPSHDKSEASFLWWLCNKFFRIVQKKTGQY
ncbi:MAG TPA: hypothetical protein DEG92_07605 [Rikenellaceae bacterium]|nr:hypothetical protein [Rikenellaceae bacterium]